MKSLKGNLELVKKEEGNRFKAEEEEQEEEEEKEKGCRLRKSKTYRHVQKVQLETMNYEEIIFKKMLASAIKEREGRNYEKVGGR